MFCVFDFFEQLREWHWIGGVALGVGLVVLGGEKTENNCGNGNGFSGWGKFNEINELRFFECCQCCYCSKKKK